MVERTQKNKKVYMIVAHFIYMSGRLRNYFTKRMVLLFSIEQIFKNNLR